MEFIIGLIFAVFLGLTHLLARSIRQLHLPRSKFLSMASGISVAYVFIHILPELERTQSVVARQNVLLFLEHHVYIMALFGFMVFYGMERLACRSRCKNREKGNDVTSTEIFWIHISHFVVYNALIGYLILNLENNSLLAMALFAIAMFFHLFVIDYGLRRHHKHQYEIYGRWILFSAVILGYLIAYFAHPAPAIVSLFFSFLAGSIILNVIKEELPDEKKGGFWAFAIGAAGFTLILLII